MANENVVGYYQADHDRLEGFFKSFQNLKCTEFPKAKESFKRFHSGLLRHIKWEEEILFPVFEEKTGHKNEGPTEVMRQEHVQIKAALEAIHDFVRKQDLASEAPENELLRVLASHNEKEEQILYPMIDQVTTPEERNEIFKKMEAIPEDASGSCCGVSAE